MATTNVSTTFRPAPSTWIGLGVALFGLPAIRQVFRVINPNPGADLVTVRELLTFATAAGLLLLVTRWEQLPIRSIGLGSSVWWKSILWGIVIAILCGGAAVILAKMTGYGHGPGSSAFERLPLWLITMIVFRAGIVEELFYRGYAIERLEAMGLGKFAAAALPLLIFAAAHYTGGAANVLIALVIGGILSGFYLRRRDLVANMIAHTLVDFVANVLPRLGS